MISDRMSSVSSARRGHRSRNSRVDTRSLLTEGVANGLNKANSSEERANTDSAWINTCDTAHANSTYMGTLYERCYYRSPWQCHDSQARH